MKQRLRAHSASRPGSSGVTHPAEQSGAYVHTFQAREVVSVHPGKLFEYLDDPRHLRFLVPLGPSISSGGAASCALDEQQGHGVGARVRREGNFLGSEVAVNEEVEFYAPPRRKVWRTVEGPRPFFIGSYRMGFEVDPLPVGSDLCVFIDWNPVPNRFHRLLDWFSERCARRVVKSILLSARRRFAQDVRAAYGLGPG